MEEVSIAVESLGPARQPKKCLGQCSIRCGTGGRSLTGVFCTLARSRGDGTFPIAALGQSTMVARRRQRARERAAAGALPPLTTWLAPPTTSCRRCGRAVLAGVCACGRDDDE
jgi:hypothetical protein